MWPFPVFSREYSDGVIKADRCAQNVDDIGIAANDAGHPIKNMRPMFECIRDAGLKLTIYKCYFCTFATDFFGKPITPEGVKRQKERNTTSLEQTNVPKSKKCYSDTFVSSIIIEITFQDYLRK